MGDKRQERKRYDVPRSRRGIFGASQPPSPETTACTMEAVRPLAQAVTGTEVHYVTGMTLGLVHTPSMIALGCLNEGDKRGEGQGLLLKLTWL